VNKTSGEAMPRPYKYLFIIAIMAIIASEYCLLLSLNIPFIPVKYAFIFAFDFAFKFNFKFQILDFRYLPFLMTKD